MLTDPFSTFNLEKLWCNASAICNKAAKIGLMFRSYLVHYNIYKSINEFLWRPLKWWGYTYLKTSGKGHMCQKQVVMYSCQKIVSFVLLSKKKQAVNWSGITYSWLWAFDAISYQILCCFFKHSVSVTWPQPSQKLPFPPQQMKLDTIGEYRAW